MTVAIACKNLTVHFSGQPKPALNRINLSIEDGSFVVVLGPSGCGKSTLLNCIAGLVSPTHGVIFDRGEPVLAPSPRRGVVFQRDILFPWTDVDGNLRFALRAANVPAAEQSVRVDELLHAVRLSSETKSRRPYELSGGMRQRVGIARMLAQAPRTMLMDEPFAALDAQTRIVMQDLIVDIWQRRGATVIFVTHDVEEALRLSDTIIMLGTNGDISCCFTNPLLRPRPVSRLAEFSRYAQLRQQLYDNLGVDTACPTSTPNEDVYHVRTLIA